MIKTLQRRFVITAMAAITLLLVVLLGILNVTNAWYTSRETDKLLGILSVGETMAVPHSQPRNREQHFFSPPPDENKRMAAIYFTAKPAENGYELDLSRAPSVTEEDALALLARAEKSDNNEGQFGTYKYKKSHAPGSNYETYIFLDTSSHGYSVLRVIALSCTAGLAAWIAMLLVVIILSRRAILPIARNLEKQKQFVTDAGHEIKTPLAIILANTEALELHSGENKWSRNIKAQISRLDGLMRDLLTLAKSDEASRDIPTENVNLSELIGSCADMFREPAALRGIELKQSIPGGICLFSNRDYITRIVSAFLDNAVKYAKPQSAIFISLNASEKHTEISVRNECEALPDCEPEKLFDRFYRADAARTQKSGGYGIGLSAASALASTLGGQVFAKYGEGNSITFTVRLLQKG